LVQRFTQQTLRKQHLMRQQKMALKTQRSSKKRNV
jgi:hypothetical protein